MYNKIVLEHFTNPKNVGEIPSANGVGQAGNPADGDKITIYIKVSNGLLKDVKFKTFGCGAAIAASSMLTVMAKGKTLDQGLKITNEDVAQSLGGLPDAKMQCSNIAAHALHMAIREYQKKGEPTAEDTDISVSCSNLPDSRVLLNNNEVNRYLRNIIIPQISGKGQHKILQTNIFIHCLSIENCDILLCYLVASGFKKLFCYLENTEESDKYIAHLKDLNPELAIVVVQSPGTITEDLDLRIFLGDAEFLKGATLTNKEPFIPAIVGVSEPWQGIVKVCKTHKELDDLANKIINKSPPSKLAMDLSYAFLGTILVMEAIKQILNIGSPLANELTFDLSTMSPNGRGEKLKINMAPRALQKKVLIIGAGGLGSPIAYVLAKLGVEKIGVVDHDQVELSNLNRQILHSTSKIGILKVKSAKELINRLFPITDVEIYPYALTKANARDLVKEYDIIVDGLDNIPTRYILNDACYHEDKPLIEAGVLTFYGQITTIIPNKTPCYRCFLPEKKDTSPIPPCSEIGVLGPVPGLIGVLEAVEVFKVAAGISSNLEGNILMYDGLEADFTLIPFLRNDTCTLCGNH